MMISKFAVYSVICFIFALFLFPFGFWLNSLLESVEYSALPSLRVILQFFIFFGIVCGIVVAIVFTPYNIARISKREKMRNGSFSQWLTEHEFESGFALMMQLGTWEEPIPVPDDIQP